MTESQRLRDTAGALRLLAALHERLAAIISGLEAEDDLENRILRATAATDQYQAAVGETLAQVRSQFPTSLELAEIVAACVQKTMGLMCEEFCGILHDIRGQKAADAGGEEWKRGDGREDGP